MTPDAWLETSVATFGERCRAKLAGPGDPEAAIRAPIEELLATAGSQLGLDVVPHDEVRDTERRVRPDYAISVDGAVVGYVEVKRPGRSVDPKSFRGHDLVQWERQRDLPNLLYTNGTDWRLWRDAEAAAAPVAFFGGDLHAAGAALRAPAGFAHLLAQFLGWAPAPITSVGALVRAVAPLTRLLRGEVLDQLEAERRRSDAAAQPFLGLAEDWRSLLFPGADDRTFADGYAQTVTFGLLLARSEAIDLQGGDLHAIGQRLGEEHSLMGRALQLLTDDAAADFRVTLDLLLRVIGAVRWDRVRAGRRDTYLYLYEDFLDEYDAELRKASGSYYTPLVLVEQMTRLAEDVLRTRLGKGDGFLDPSVLTVDPAMGTGTFLNAILDAGAGRAVHEHGPGVGAGIVRSLAERVVGFEVQMGPYAVAELRTSDLLRSYGAEPPEAGMRTYVTNALDDPFTEVDQIASSLQVISASRRKANEIKGETPVTVVIGNPPYRERAEGQGGWIEAARATGRDAHAPLDDFRLAGNGRAEYVLKNLYVYFWRWATWKVFDADPDHRAGAVCFISTSGYLQGQGFKGMREYLRRTTSEGWIINVSPEGVRPPVSTRLFPTVQRELAIAIFVRSPDADPDAPSRIRYTELTGRREEKLDALARLDLDGAGWRDARTTWTAPLTPSATTAWDAWPAVSDLMPWTAPGVKPNRTWVYAPLAATLEERWRLLVAEPDPERKRTLFQESSDARLDRARTPLPGADTHLGVGPFANETGPPPRPVRVAYRSFDRQWLVPDSRLIHRESPPLWAARVPQQVFVTEQSAHAIDAGPALVASTDIPDMDHFNGRGGRVLPLLHPDGSPNLAPGLAAALGALFDRPVPDAHDVLAYVLGVTAHPAFTETFEDELTTPGVRVPLTADAAAWDEAVALGRQVGWLQSHGEAWDSDAEGRARGDVRAGDGGERVQNLRAVEGLPAAMDYDELREELRLGEGVFGPVPPSVRAYAVGGRNVLDSWFGYRKASPSGKRTATTSPLADVLPRSWPVDWSIELVDLLTVLRRLVALEERQAALLAEVLDGPLLDSGALATAGVRWPSVSADRAVRRELAVPGGLDLSGGADGAL